MTRRALDGIDLDEPIDGLIAEVGVVGVRRRSIHPQKESPMRLIAAVLVALLLVLARPALAQTPACASPSSQTSPPTFNCMSGRDLTALWDYTDTVVPGDVFRLYVNGAQVGPDIAARTATSISVQFGSTLPPGTYTVAVSAVRPSAVSPESARIPVTLVLVAPPPPTPPAPTNIRVVEVIIRGLDSAGNVLWEHTERMTAAVAP